MPRPRNLLIAALLLPLTACSNGSSTTTEISVGADLKPAPGWLSSGASLQLAAALLAGDTLRPGGTGAAMPPVGLGLLAELTHTADGVVRFLALESGAGADPTWSPLVERLAESANAPQDENDNGTNRDEVLAELREQYVFRTNARLPAGAAHAFLLPGPLATRLAGKPTARDDLAGLRLEAAPATNLTFRTGDLGAAILAWTRRAASLLSAGRGDLYGRTGEEGMRGLLLLEKALAAERLLLEKLTFGNGTLGGIDDPAAYDATRDPRLFATTVTYTMRPAQGTLPAEPTGFRLSDRGASLLDQALLLRGFAELAWLASKDQSNALLRRLFEGDPFGTRPGAGPVSRDEPRDPRPTETITWEKHIAGLLQSRCSGKGCHDPGKANDFSVNTYADVLLGGKNRETNPTVIKGKPFDSLLWQIVALPKPPVSQPMPQGAQRLGKAETDLIADWIKDGALERDPGQRKATPVHGLDGVLVVLRNLEAMHLEKVSGALVDRADLLGRGDAVHADSAGAILQALAAVREALPSLTEGRTLLEGHALFVARKLVDEDGRVLESYLLDPDEPSEAPASVGAAAAVVAGLFEAHRVLGRDELKKAAELAADFLLKEYLTSRTEPVSFPGSNAARLTASDVAWIVEAAAAWFDVTGDDRAKEVVDRLWAQLKRAGFVLGEWSATGETFGDGDRDTDADGVLEVGTDGNPPLFAFALENEFLQRGLGIPARRIHYSRDVLPTLIVHCGACHTGGASRGGFQCDTYEDVFRGGDFRDRMKSVVPGNPAASLLWRKVEDRPPPLGGEMPEAGPPLAPVYRDVMRIWIEEGARKN